MLVERFKQFPVGRKLLEISEFSSIIRVLTWERS